MLLPSNELLSVVLGVNASVDGLTKEDTILVYKKKGIGILRTINIYELQHKMKEWAYKNSVYYIESYINSCGSYAMVYKNYSEEPYFNCIEDTEFEALVMASEFILKEIA